MHRPKGALFSKTLPVSGVRRVFRTNFETRGRHLYTLLSKSVGRDEGLVADIGVVGQDESKLAIRKVGRGRWRVIEPLKEISKGEQSLVKGPHDLWVCCWCCFARVSVPRISNSVLLQGQTILTVAAVKNPLAWFARLTRTHHHRSRRQTCHPGSPWLVAMHLLFARPHPDLRPGPTLGLPK